MGTVVDDQSIIRTISALLDIDPGRVTATTLLSDLVTDSFMLVQLAMDVQEEFDVILYADDVNGIETVGDLIEILRDPT